jgi:hypothetical protein
MSCPMFVGVVLCNGQDGCLYTSKSCGGTETPCADLSTQSSCIAELCQWSGTSCSGTPPSCDFFTPTECPQAMGCTVQPESCTGEPRACSKLTDVQSCLRQNGCVWN